MYAYIKYSNKNVKSNYQRFGVTFNVIEQQFDIIKDFNCEDHLFVSQDKNGKKKYWKDAEKRAIYILSQLLVDPNLTVNPVKGASDNEEKALVKVYEQVKKLEIEKRTRSELTERIPDNRKKDKQNSERLKNQSETIRENENRIKMLERKIEELSSVKKGAK